MFDHPPHIHHPLSGRWGLKLGAAELPAAWTQATPPRRPAPEPARAECRRRLHSAFTPLAALPRDGSRVSALDEEKASPLDPLLDLY